MNGLPAGWRWSSVAEVGSSDLGRQRHPDWHTGPEMRPYLRVANVFEDRIDTADVKEMDFTGCFDRYRLAPGDVLLNEGQSPEFLGRPAIYRGVPEDVAFTNTLIRFRPGPDITAEWALLVFRHYMHCGRFAAESRITTNIAHLSIGRFKTVEFPVPGLREQRRIVDMLEEHLSSLDAADRYLTSASKRVDGLWAALLESNFGAALSARVPLASYVSSIFAGKSLGASTPPARLDEWGIIKVSAMTRGDFRETENKAVPTDRIDPRHEIHAGDLLVSRANTADYVGASVLVPQGVRPRLLLSDKSLRIVPAEGVRVEWLWRALQTPSARQQISQLATGTKDSMRNISQPSLLRVLVPNADPAEQVAAVASFAEHAECVERQSQALRSAQSRASDLRRALLSAAFSGRLTGRSSDCQLIEELADQEAS